MKEIFSKYNLSLSQNQQDLFDEYYRLLIEYNSRFNITAITDREEVIVKHFVDSAIGCGKVCGKRVIDIGSGGGFPALPIKIMNDEIELTLLEATGKKCEFLSAVVSSLGLKKVTIINDRAETLAKNLSFRERFDCCTARAVARLNTLAEYCIPFVKVGGSMVAFKGDADEEVKEAVNAVNLLGGEIVDNFKYELEGAKRALITIKKVKNTPNKYPRGNGKERKNPL